MDITHEQLQAALVGLTDDAYTPDDDRYLDWSIRDQNGYSLSVGDDDDEVTLRLTDQEFATLVTRMIATLLRNK